MPTLSCVLCGTSRSIPTLRTCASSRTMGSARSMSLREGGKRCSSARSTSTEPAAPRGTGGVGGRFAGALATVMGLAVMGVPDCTVVTAPLGLGTKRSVCTDSVGVLSLGPSILDFARLVSPLLPALISASLRRYDSASLRNSSICGSSAPSQRLWRAFSIQLTKLSSFPITSLLTCNLICPVELIDGEIMLSTIRPAWAFNSAVLNWLPMTWVRKH